MKAVCVRTVLAADMFVKIGEVVDYEYTVENGFIVNGIAIKSAIFFGYFKIQEGDGRMTYSDFEYVLCNYVFDAAVLFPQEYSGTHHLIIQDWGGVTVMITVNQKEDTIRVSYPDGQKVYKSYVEALDEIRNWKNKSIGGILNVY